ncbi:hypothetical protein M9Y10_012544 [Tritrichomonas musculus]|uniref:Bromo domain-containing protein n=1 Tax=Tritrichomonas musculus TaxID=1915356 RepID=A0ABR2ICR2_9EUKA
MSTQNKISPEQLNQCIQITETMYNKPSCFIFRAPVDPVRDQVPNYFDVIKDPQDLGTILERLQNKEYSSIQSWKHDMDLVWDNAKAFNGPFSIVSSIAVCMKGRFEKIYQNTFMTPKEWNNRINELFSKLNVVMKAAPGKLKNEFEGKKFSGPMTRNELQKLAEAASSLTDISDVLQMEQLLNIYGVNIDFKKDDCFVVLKNLPKEALQALQSFVKDRYRALRKHYPD